MPRALVWRVADLSERAILHVRTQSEQGELPGFGRTLGLPEEALAELYAATGMASLQPFSAARRTLPVLPSYPYAPLLALLWSFRQEESPLTQAVAATVATATFGARHLWQDLGLGGRDDVTCLLQGHFPELVALNTSDLKWKRFLYQRLGHMLGQEGLRPPRCGGCDQYAGCYGSA